MSFKSLLLAGLLSFSLVLVGCNKKEESTSQSKPIQHSDEQNTPKEDEQNDMSSMLDAAVEDAQKQADQNK